MRTLCGNGVIDFPEQCDGANLNGATCSSLGFALGGTLTCTAGCAFDTTGCVGQAFPSTGQTNCYGSAGDQYTCTCGRSECTGSSPGQYPGSSPEDGDVQAGGALAYVDNGDGTITDLNTHLMWEKKSADGSIHDVNTFYSWNNALNNFFPVPNAGSGFAGYTDWRQPNYKELTSILDLQNANPAVAAAFNTNCTPGCTVTTCSCTGSGPYWSSTTTVNNTSAGWVVDFGTGFVDSMYKDLNLTYIRGVRGGF